MFVPIDVLWFVSEFLGIEEFMVFRCLCVAASLITSKKWDTIMSSHNQPEFWSIVASNGWVDVLDFMAGAKKFANLLREPELLNVMAENGQLTALRWAHKVCPAETISLNRWVCSNAARNSFIYILKWAFASGYKLDNYVYIAAAAHGRIDVLEWIFGEKDIFNSCPWNVKACAAAAGNGRLDVLQYLRKKGCPWDASVCCSAARSGHLNILQWARGEGSYADGFYWRRDVCPWNENVCAFAAGTGRLEILQWLRDSSRVFGICPWDANTCKLAEQHGHRDVLEWAVANGCPH